MRLFFGLLIFSIGSFSFAGTQYQCIGSGKLKSKPQAVVAKDLPKNFETSPTTTKLNLTIEKVYCPQAKNDELFLISSHAPLKGADYQAYFNPLPNRELKKNDSVYFRVVWSCDKKCREKNWSEVSEADFAKEYAEDDLIDGCQGEGCGCTEQKKANKDFDLYEKMDLKSKVLGKFKAGTEAIAGKATTKVLSKGKSKVTDVKDSALGLKYGDEVNTVFNLGEGFTKVKHGDKWIDFPEDNVTLKEVEPFKYENWLEVTVGKLHGYTPTFPFMGCLE